MNTDTQHIPPTEWPSTERTLPSAKWVVHRTKMTCVKGPIVWVLQDSGTINLYPATKYGTISTFTRAEMPILDPDMVQQWEADLGVWLSYYSPSIDFILLAGDPVLISAASAMLGCMFSQYTVLKWDRQERVYIPVVLRPSEGVRADWEFRENEE